MAHVTDTGFAQPAKAAARREQERLRGLPRLKAREQGAPLQHKVGPRELLQVAETIRDAMVSLAADRNQVLVEARACGWCHYRPDTQEHKLKPVLGQPWAAGLTEGSSRIGPEQRSERGADVTDGVPNPLLDKKLEPAEGQAQLSYFDQDAELDLVLLGQQAVQQGLDELRLEAALLHPKVRSQEEETLAEVALLTSQTAVRQRDSEAE